MDELKTVLLGSILIALSTIIYSTILSYMGGQGLIIKFSVYSIFLPIIITFLVTFKLAEDFKLSLLYGFFLGLVYITIDTLLKNIYGLNDFNLSLNFIILFSVIFIASGGIGSRFGIVKKALYEIKSGKAD
jgi:hypothetical protein